jgi:hypothetical protein
MSHISTNLSYLLRQLVPLYNIYAPNQRHLSEWSYAWVISHMIPSCPARMQYMTSVTVHHAYIEHVHSAYNSFFQLVFQPKQYFSLITNQPTVFFSRLISPTEWGVHSSRCEQYQMQDPCLS